MMVPKSLPNLIFEKLNVGIVFDEGGSFHSACWATWVENLLKSIESARRFRALQFDLVKAGLKAEGKVISTNMAFLKAGTPSPTKNEFR
ncbi:hypothetical protein PanWU01x14_045690 [Parasponia andersonii]|uniref:Uncharacterized protein n=1 Tax=Parasponia andersonii TaxID=3476 RepID=A0A2P5DPK1_PARAD|nr:hypothetical protein PanWU01x14_045690 [Parasponia andersonii]